eukprot:4817769-Alexandrium_andersonii.AAC.1
MNARPLPFSGLRAYLYEAAPAVHRGPPSPETPPKWPRGNCLRGLWMPTLLGAIAQNHWFAPAAARGGRSRQRAAPAQADGLGRP